MARFGPITAFECPADGCDWKATTEDIDRTQPPIRARLTYREDGPPIIDSSEWQSECAARLDRFLREHLETHDVFDWVRTVRNRDQQIYNLQNTGVRPHVYGSQREADRG